MTILVTNISSPKNIGDFAITRCLLKEIQRVWPKTEVVLCGLDAGGIKQVFPKHTVIPSVHDWAVYQGSQSLVVQLLRSACGMVASSLITWFRLPARLAVSGTLSQIIDEHRRADLVICSGGGGIRVKDAVNISANFNAFLVGHTALLPILCGKPVYWFSQSFGPLANPFVRWWVMQSVSRSQLFCAREDKSIQWLKKYSAKTKLVRTSDVAFLFTSPASQPSTAITATVTVRQWLTGEAHQHYLNQMALVIVDLVHTYQARVTILPHVRAPQFKEDDFQVSKELFKMLPQQIKPNVKLETKLTTLEQVSRQFGKSTLTIGTRMHSVILSLVADTPCIAIEYEHKTGEIMRDMGLGKYVHRIEEVNAKLISSQVSQLIKDRQAMVRRMRAQTTKLMILARVAMNTIAEDVHYR